jgi:homoserine acetyltransferase
MAFPPFSIRDMVASQAALLDAIGVGRLHAVIDASMERAIADPPFQPLS